MSTRDTLFADIDTMDPDKFAQHLAEDVRMRFGNAAPIHGRDACRDAWAEFCQGIDGVRHDLVDVWDTGEAGIAEAEVTYTKQDGTGVSVPVVTIYRPGGGAPIEDYRIFIDLAPLFGG